MGKSATTQSAVSPPAGSGNVAGMGESFSLDLNSGQGNFSVPFDLPDGIAGYDLCPTVQRQAADQGAEFQRAEVSRLEAEDRFWSVVTDEERHRAKAVAVYLSCPAQKPGSPASPTR